MKMTRKALDILLEQAGLELRVSSKAINAGRAWYCFFVKGSEVCLYTVAGLNNAVQYVRGYMDGQSHHRG